MKYLDKKFSTPPNSKAYVDNWDAVFGEKPDAERKDRDESKPSESLPNIPTR